MAFYVLLNINKQTRKSSESLFDSQPVVWAGWSVMLLVQLYSGGWMKCNLFSKWKIFWREAVNQTWGSTMLEKVLEEYSIQDIVLVWGSCQTSPSLQSSSTSANSINRICNNTNTESQYSTPDTTTWRCSTIWRYDISWDDNNDTSLSEE